MLTTAAFFPAERLEEVDALPARIVGMKRLLEHKFINLMPTPYHPPFTLTPCQVTLVAEICGWIGRWMQLHLASELHPLEEVKHLVSQ